MKTIFKKLLIIAVSIGILSTLFYGNAMASPIQEGAAAARVEGMPENLIGADGALTRFTNIALYIVGVISVIMLIWGGLRYIISGGDGKKITDAKNTILYAIIGLVIVFFAFAIVNFVLNTIDPVTHAEATSLILAKSLA